MKFKKGDIVGLDVEKDSYNNLDKLKGVIVDYESHEHGLEYVVYLVMWATSENLKEWIYEDSLILL